MIDQVYEINKDKQYTPICVLGVFPNFYVMY